MKWTDELIVQEYVSVSKSYSESDVLVELVNELGE